MLEDYTGGLGASAYVYQLVFNATRCSFRRRTVLPNRMVRTAFCANAVSSVNEVSARRYLNAIDGEARRADFLPSS